MDAITIFICDFFEKRGKLTGDVVEFTNRNFLEEKILDSIEFITLISEIEEHYNILFSQEEMQSPEFGSVKGIALLVSAKLK